MNPSNKVRNHVADIQTAAHKLDEFNQSNERSTVAKVFSLLKYNPEKLQHRKELLWAIRQLQIYSRTLPDMQRGDSKEQEVADKAIKAIKRFNAFIDRTGSRAFNKHFANFLLTQNSHLSFEELAKIQLPPFMCVEVYFSEKEKGPTLDAKKVSSNSACSAKDKISFLSRHITPAFPLQKGESVPHLSKQALELFKMKVIALMEKHALLSNVEARRSMRKAIIQADVDPDNLLCMATCTVNPFPGQLIYVKGAFEFDANASLYSILQSKSIQFTFSSTQTSFPHCLQYTGWAQPDLIPPFLHHLEKTPLFKSLYQQKLEVSQQLLSDGELLQHAKKWVQLKREAFDQHKKELLDLHQELSLTIIEAATGAACEASHKKVAGLLNDFYGRVKLLNNPYDFFADTHQLILENFALNPYERLQQAWTMHQQANSCEELFVEELNKSHQELHQILQGNQLSDLDRTTIDFMNAFGAILAPAWKKIILQQFSEVGGFAAPVLTLFDLKNQIAMFKQAECFMEELALPPATLTGEFALERFRAQITRDTALYRAQSLEEVEKLCPATQYVLELKNYFGT